MNKKNINNWRLWFYRTQFSFKAQKENYKVSIIDSLGVNNLKTVRENDITNKKLYKKILENRIRLLKKIRSRFS